MSFGVRQLGGMLATAVILLGLTPLSGAAAAAALPARSAAAPLGQFAGTLTFSVERITPDLISADSIAADGTATLTISGTVTNTGPEALTDVVARVQRGDALESPEELQAEIADPGQPGSSWTDFGDLVERVEPGATVPFTIDADVFGAQNHSLHVTALGVFPVMVNVNAKFASGPAGGARVGELHALLTVAALPASQRPSSANPAAPAAVTATQTYDLIFPLVDRPHRDPTGAFTDDDLSTLISAGGRLSDVLNAAVDTGLPAGAITLAVDPELLEELQLMSKGYTVGPFVFDITRGAATATATPSTDGSANATGSATTSTPITTTGSASGDELPTTSATGTDSAATSPTTSSSYVPVPAPTAVPGTGTRAAAAFLARLRQLTAAIPTLVLPYTDIDAVAAVRAGRADQVSSAISRGRQIAGEVLGAGARLVTDIGWPIDGLIDDPTVAVFRDAGIRTAVLDAGGVTLSTAAATAAIPTGGRQLTGLLSTSSVPVGAVELNAFTAITAQNYFSDEAKSLVYAPSRNFEPTDNSFQAMTSVLGELAGVGMVTGSTIGALGGGPGAAPGSLAYRASAAQHELPLALFTRVSDLVSRLAATQEAFKPIGPVGVDDQPTTAPEDLFSGLVDGMSRLAAGGYRGNPAAGSASMAVVDTIIQTVQAGVFINPPAGAYTLTSSSSPLLVTIRNDLPYTVYLRVRVNPEDALLAGIQVQDVGIQTIPAGRPKQVLIPAEVTRSGSLSVGVQLTNPDGSLWGAEQTLQMKSTAYGAFTVTMIIVAGGVVVLTSAGRIRKRFKERRQRIAAGVQ